MTETKALQAASAADMLPILEMKRRLQAVLDAIKEIMISGRDYGVIPGTQKPTLLQPGAEKLCVMFRLAPTFAVDVSKLEGGHREYHTQCTLTHGPSGTVWATADGLCSTMEKKYRWRDASRKCPECGEPAIIKGKKEYGGGWVCYKKKGGCGQTWKDGDQVIEGQEVGRIENEDIADLYNTCLKMSQKRSLVGACKIATAASDYFTQDTEDFYGIVDEKLQAMEAYATGAALPPARPIEAFMAMMQRAFAAGGLTAVADYWSGAGQAVLKASTVAERQRAVDLREEMKRRTDDATANAALAAKDDAEGTGSVREPKRRGRPPKTEAREAQEGTSEGPAPMDGEAPATDGQPPELPSLIVNQAAELDQAFEQGTDMGRALWVAKNAEWLKNLPPLAFTALQAEYRRLLTVYLPRGG